MSRNMATDLNRKLRNPKGLASFQTMGLRLSASSVSLMSTLVESFDIEPFSDLSAKWSNFRGLVLFCIDDKFCK